MSNVHGSGGTSNGATPQKGQPGSMPPYPPEELRRWAWDLGENTKLWELARGMIDRFKPPDERTACYWLINTLANCDHFRFDGVERVNGMLTERAVKQAVGSAIITTPGYRAWKEHERATAKPEAAKPSFPMIGSAEFLAADYRRVCLIDRFLARGQPGVIAGPSKTLKTSLLVDMGISLASGHPFLGRFDVATPTRVAIASGESGKATLQDTAWRVLRAKQLGPDALADRLAWCFDLPQFLNLENMAAFADALLALNVELVFVDPTYLCLGGDIDHASLFQMGEAFRAVNEILQKNGVQTVLVHHANRSLKVGEQMEFTHLAYSGLEQFCGQWTLINRRTPYRSDGNHDLWLNSGSRDGMGGLWAVRVEERLADRDFQGRVWNVTVEDAGEVFAARANEKAEKKVADRQTLLKRHQTDVLNAVDVVHESGRGGATLNEIRIRAGLNKPNAEVALDALVRDGVLEKCRFEKRVGDRGKVQAFDGYRRPGHKPPELKLLDDTPDRPPESKAKRARRRKR